MSGLGDDHGQRPPEHVRGPGGSKTQPCGALIEHVQLGGEQLLTCPGEAGAGVLAGEQLEVAVDLPQSMTNARNGQASR